MQYLIWFSSFLLCVMGLLGTTFPALPGTPLIFIATWLLAWWDNYQHIGALTITLSAVLTALSLLVDFAATAYGAKRVGASGYAITGAAVGTVIGAFFFIPGLLVGPFLGAIAGELLVKREFLHLGKVGTATWIGLLLGTAFKVAIAFTMIGLLLVALIV